MKRFFAIILFSGFALSAISQGKILDAVSGEPLSAASIILFSSGKRQDSLLTRKEFFLIRLRMILFVSQWLAIDRKLFLQKSF